MALDTAAATVVLRDLTAKFDRAVSASTPFYPSVCNIIQSDGADEKYGWIGGMPGVKEFLGERKFEQLRAANYTLANKHWESSLLISKNNLADDRMGMYGPLLSNLGSEAAYHPDSLWFDALVAGETELCFDGQYFFDTDHSWGDSGTQDNDLTGAAATGTVPTAAELKAAFHTMRTAMLKFKGDNGKFFHRPVIGKMSDLTLLVPPEFEVAAYEGLTSAIFGGGNTNVVVDAPNIVVSPYLTSSAKMYLFYTGGNLKPFVFQAREPLSRQVKGLTDLETKDVKFMTEARYNVGYLAWWNAVLYTFT